MLQFFRYPRGIIPVNLHSFLWHENVVASHDYRAHRNLHFSSHDVSDSIRCQSISDRYRPSFILRDGQVSLLMTIFMLGVLEDALVFGQTATALWSYRPKAGKSTTGFES